eukprot:scaffold24319_cov124-Skeletonema_marinoi.AAC.1
MEMGLVVRMMLQSMNCIELVREAPPLLSVLVLPVDGDGASTASPPNTNIRLICDGLRPHWVELGQVEGMDVRWNNQIFKCHRPRKFAIRLKLLVPSLCLDKFGRMNSNNHNCMLGLQRFHLCA